MAANRLAYGAFAALASLLFCATAPAQEGIDPNIPAPSDAPARTANGLALRPPIGWNSWNKFNCTVNDRTVRATADAMVARG